MTHFIYRLKALVLCAAAVTSVKAATLTFSYNSQDLTCTITGWTGTPPSGELRIPLRSTNPADGKTYKVVAVEAGVFDNLENIQSILIRKNIRRIGNARGNEFSEGGLLNFRNCPELQFIEVEDGNTAFRHTDAGTLVSYNSKILYRVPPQVDVAGSRLNISASVQTIAPEAFAGNETVEVIGIPGSLVTISAPAGFNSMKNLREFDFTDYNEDFYIYNGALCNRKRHSVISMPPKNERTSYWVPLAENYIEEEAFANCANLREVHLHNTVEQIDSRAFARSGLETIELPSCLDFMNGGESMLHNCPALREITITRANTIIPVDFARDCPVLKKVNITYPPNKISRSAFKDCPSLDEMPLFPETAYGDSVFAGSGMTKVRYEKGDYCFSTIPHGLFDSCRKLTEIDLSNFTADDDYELFDGFATRCPRLAKVIFPEKTMIWGTPFGSTNNISEISIGDFGVQGYVFSLTNRATYEPDIYVSSQATYPQHKAPLDHLFSLNNGATLKARIFCDAYIPADDYAVAGCTYYVPAKAARYYSQAEDVTEMFTISVSTDPGTGKAMVNGHARTSGSYLISCTFNGEPKEYRFDNGACATDIATSLIQEITVNFGINDYKMSTTYPAADLITDGLDTVDAAPADEEYEIITISGVTVARGKGNLAGHLNLEPGTYIIRTASGCRKITI